MKLASLAFLTWIAICQAQDTYLDEPTGTKPSRSKRPPPRITDFWWVAKIDTAAELTSPLPRDKVAITLVLPLSAERLYPLEVQCQLYAFRPSVAFAAALYIGLFNGMVHSRYDPDINGKPLEDVVSYLKDWQKKMTGYGCIMDLNIYTENMPDTNDWHTFPNNAMRNKALQMARTEVVALLDADFIMGPTSFANDFQLGSPMYERAVSVMKNHSVMIMPAFEIIYHEQMDVDDTMKAITESKENLWRAFTMRKVERFHHPNHNNTAYHIWWRAHEEYEIQYLKEGEYVLYAFEPYIMALKKGLPCYDERFRGYFYNKISFLYNLYRRGYKYHVHPGAYVIHYPHAPVNDKAQQRAGQRRKTLTNLMRQIADEMTLGKYIPIVGDGMCTLSYP